MMNDSTAVQRESKFSFAKVILCVIMLLCVLALAVTIVPADTRVGVTASAATQSQLKSKQSQLESQAKASHIRYWFLGDELTIGKRRINYRHL